MNEHMWWELWDPDSQLAYYYNAATGGCVWERPVNDDIIPLTKMQVIIVREMRECLPRVSFTSTRAQVFVVS